MQAVLDPVRALPNGDVCFAWSDLWANLGTGYYEADLFTDGRNCNTLLFYVRDCAISVSSSSPVIDDGCATACEPCCGTVPQIDDEIAPSNESCEDECNACEE